MAKKFSSVGELETYLTKFINLALDGTVAENIKNLAVTNADATVYGGYNPRMYGRRGSLVNPGNYEVEKEADLKVGVTPVAEFNPHIREKVGKSWADGISQNSGNMLAGLVNYGDGWNGYSYDFEPEDPEDEDDVAYLAPRPFLDQTVMQLEDGFAVELLQQALAEFGIIAK